MDGHPGCCPQALWLTHAAIIWEQMLVISIAKYVIFSVIMFVLISAVVIARSSSLQMNPLAHTSSFEVFGQYTLFSSESVYLYIVYSTITFFQSHATATVAKAFDHLMSCHFFDSCLQYLAHLLTSLSQNEGLHANSFVNSSLGLLFFHPISFKCLIFIFDYKKYNTFVLRKQWLFSCF